MYRNIDGVSEITWMESIYSTFKTEFYTIIIVLLS